MKRVLFLALALLSGCAGQPPCGSWGEDGHSYDGGMCSERLAGRVTISDGYSPEQQAAIMAAGDAWAQKTQGRVALVWAIADFADVYPGTCGPPGVAGMAYPKTGTICLTADEPVILRARAEHELGHYFGLSHTPEGVMRPVIDADAAITDYDLEHFDRLWEERK